ncbi:unnamed protein product [Mytilus coruscus]|uniref:B box-type domain-containing protein n=1 Tax=Mytilus coruscus TaxID=42192 RepID=A0A6J8A5V2_MYTCO|nr:unnamed protein product [Mytilus coruscus]
MDEICCECYQQLVLSPILTFKTCLKCHKSVCIVCDTKHESKKDHSFGIYHFPHLSNFCLKHKRELLQKYCVKCRTAVCSSCYRQWHEGHKTMSFYDVANDSKRNLKKEKDSIHQELKKVIKETEKGQEIYNDFALKLKYIYTDVERIVFDIRQKQAEILNYASYGIHGDIDSFLNEMLSLTVRQRVGYERYRILTKIDKEKDSYKYLSLYHYYQSWLQQCVVIPKADLPQLQALNVKHNKPPVEEVRKLLLNIEIGNKSKQKAKTSDNNEEERTKKLSALNEKDKIIADHRKELQKRGDEMRCMRKAMQFMNANLMRSNISNASMKMKMIESISDYPQVLETIQEFQRNMEDIKHTINKKDML